jgi:hypothetical protein
MKALILPVIAAMAALPGFSESSRALSLCNCCVAQQVEQCMAACAAMTSAPGQCPAFVDYTPAKKRPAVNPLYSMSLKEIFLGEPNARQLESWRRFLEKHRRRAVRDYNKAAYKYRKGRLDDVAMASAKARLNQALVNYNHGIRAYEVAIGRKPE